ncbi:MAG: alpha/beta fold hydrolase [Pseudomonadota bacterium]
MDLTDPPSTLRAPGPHLLALESRAPVEAVISLALWPLLTQGPAGDGHTVLVFPGLAAPDASTVLLRHFLQQRGYEPRCWELGVNLGPRPGVFEACLQRVHDLQRESGRKISVIGWSLGGIYARELAKLAPDAIRSVISLGTPFTGDPKASNAWRLYEFASGLKAGGHAAHHQFSVAPPMPTTSIFSRSDGVVNWRCSIQEAGPQTENIEVFASHGGLGMNPAALYAIADRLAQPEGEWQPFEPTGMVRWAYGSGRESESAPV